MPSSSLRVAALNLRRLVNLGFALKGGWRPISA
jgi:hypothetical protein